MSSFIVDASVAIQRFVEEPDSERADSFYRGHGAGGLAAPETIVAEVCDIALRKAHNGSPAGAIDHGNRVGAQSSDL